MRHLLLSAMLCIATLPATAQVQPDLAQDARVSEGRAVFLAGDEAAALAILIPEAEAGHPRAQNILGAAHQYGRGVPMDAALAQQWLGRAAAQGYPPALHNLGYLFEYGMVGLDPDPTVAREWYRQAASFDYAPSIGNYGKFLYEGTGGPVDRVEAFRQFRRGAEMGDPLSLEWYGYHLQTGEQVAVDLPAARRHFQAAGLMGMGWSMDQYGRMLEFGEGGPQDLIGAMAAYVRAVELNEPYAGISAAWMTFDHPDLFPDIVLGGAYCLWAVDNAGPEEQQDWRTSCDDLLSDLSPVQLTQARKKAATL